ncbi:MAG: type VII toxin-antitoxin system HepT family RNase toxin [Candidatus Binatia bacterium]
MTDAELVAKKLARVESALVELRTFATAEEIARDLKTERFVEHTLQIAIQAAIDAASHVVSDERLGEPEANRDLFLLLARHGWIPGEIAERLARMAGFRNVLVHGYEQVDLAIVRDVFENRLGDFEEYVAAIRARLRG